MIGVKGNLTLDFERIDKSGKFFYCFHSHLIIFIQIDLYRLNAMDLWLLECAYQKLIGKVGKKIKKEDGLHKKMLLMHIINELKKDASVVSNFRPIETIRPQRRRKAD